MSPESHDTSQGTVFTRRIIGIETEFGITFTHEGQRKLAPDDIARQLFRPIVEQFRSSNIYTHNGGRLYLDVGSHPEYATPECDSLSQALLYDRAGEAQVNQLAEQAEAALAERRIEGTVHLFKNNTDSLGNSYGCHENYLVGRNVLLRQLGHELIPFLLTRQLICGAGLICVPKKGAPNEHAAEGYRLSQRADHVWEGVSSATTRSRPIINTRDEPHADSERFRRLHIIVGDSNMSETTAALKIGSALLVLEMLEAGYQFDQWDIANEPVAIRAISRDITGRIPVALRNGEQSCALEIQQAYCAAARQWLSERPEQTNGTPTSEMTRVVELWEKVLTAIDSGDLASISRDIDWVIKKNLIDRYQDKYGWELTHPRLLQLGYAYHDVRPTKGILRVMEARGLVSRWLDNPDANAAITTPPQTTRAKMRGEFLARAQEVGADVSVDWTRLKINRPEPREVALLDPFANSDEKAAELLAELLDMAEPADPAPPAAEDKKD